MLTAAHSDMHISEFPRVAERITQASVVPYAPPSTIIILQKLLQGLEDLKTEGLLSEEALHQTFYQFARLAAGHTCIQERNLFADFFGVLCQKGLSLPLERNHEVGAFEVAEKIRAKKLFSDKERGWVMEKTLQPSYTAARPFSRGGAAILVVSSQTCAL